MTRRTHLAAAAMAMAIGLAACGDDSANPVAESPPPAADPGADDSAGNDNEVVIQGFRFQPAQLEVPVGTTVTWRNTDGINHTATSGAPGADDGVFDIDMPEAGTSGEHTFGEAGTFVYYCQVHESMTAEVVVTG